MAETLATNKPNNHIETAAAVAVAVWSKDDEAQFRAHADAQQAEAVSVAPDVPTLAGEEAPSHYVKYYGAGIIIAGEFVITEPYGAVAAPN